MLSSCILTDFVLHVRLAAHLTYATACFAQAAVMFADEVWEPAAHTLGHNQQNIRSTGPEKQTAIMFKYRGASGNHR